MTYTLSALRATQAIRICDFTPDEDTAVTLISIGTKAQQVNSWAEAAAVLFNFACDENDIEAAPAGMASDLDGISEHAAFEIARGLAEAFSLVLTINVQTATGPVLIYSTPAPALGGVSKKTPEEGDEDDFGQMAFHSLLTQEEVHAAIGEVDDHYDDEMTEDDFQADETYLSHSDMNKALGEEVDTDVEEDEIYQSDPLTSEEMQSRLGIIDDDQQDAVIPTGSRSAAVAEVASEPGIDEETMNTLVQIDFSDLDEILAGDETPPSTPVDIIDEDIGIRVNDIVKLEVLKGKNEICYMIDRNMEEDPEVKAHAAELGAKPVMSYSPKGKSLIGMRLHDDVTFKSGRRMITANITEIISPKE
ncbi:MAG: hypothetical protein ABJN42_08575 [Roseibium sp.]|uniref:hypothetical protein n=1 Tax=Roseibium sp. TaxID=1936156 RepID=UPI003297E2C4